MKNAELRWNDLLDALETPGIVAEQAALKLHSLLGIPTNLPELNIDRSYWTGVLQRRKIDPTSLASAQDSDLLRLIVLYCFLAGTSGTICFGWAAVDASSTEPAPEHFHDVQWPAIFQLGPGLFWGAAALTAVGAVGAGAILRRRSWGYPVLLASTLGVLFASLALCSVTIDAAFALMPIRSAASDTTSVLVGAAFVAQTFLLLIFANHLFSEWWKRRGDSVAATSPQRLHTADEGGLASLEKPQPPHAADDLLPPADPLNPPDDEDDALPW